MPPEKSAYALARYSRSPDSIRDSIDWVRTPRLARQHKQGEARHLDAHAGENLLELGHHHDHQQNHDAHRHDEHGDRIKERGLDLALDLLRLFGKFREAFQHHFQHAAQFARLDHVHEQAVENLGVLREGLGKRAATFNRQRQFAENFFEHGAAFLLFEHAQSAQERQTRVHQRRQLPRERGQDLRFDLSAQPRDVDVDVERAAFFAAAGPGPGRFLLGRLFFLDFFGFDDFGGEQAHFLDPANGLVLAGDFNRAFRFLATVVQSDVIVFRHSGMSSAPNAFGVTYI